jgi:hypothetical protein
VAPQVWLPSQAKKHLKLVPSGAQSLSTPQALEQAVVDEVHPASVKVPRGRHESPAAHCELLEHPVPAACSVLLPQAARDTKRRKAIERKALHIDRETILRRYPSTFLFVNRC